MTLDITWSWPTWRGKTEHSLQTTYYYQLTVVSQNFPTVHSMAHQLSSTHQSCMEMMSDDGVPWNRKCNIATNRWHMSRVNHGVSFSLDSLLVFESQKHWLKYVFIARKEGGPLPRYKWCEHAAGFQWELTLMLGIIRFNLPYIKWRCGMQCCFLTYLSNMLEQVFNETWTYIWESCKFFRY